MKQIKLKSLSGLPSDDWTDVFDATNNAIATGYRADGYRTAAGISGGCNAAKGSTAGSTVATVGQVTVSGATAVSIMSTSHGTQASVRPRPASPTR
jgi:hypothetical protein